MAEGKAVASRHDPDLAELDARSNQLAHHLHALGVGPDEIVGLLTERSSETARRASSACEGRRRIPARWTRPTPRPLAYMLEDSGTRVLVTQERVLRSWELDAAELETGSWPSCAWSSRLARDRPTSNSRLPASNLQPLAYIIYTSGSTGRPRA